MSKFGVSKKISFEFIIFVFLAKKMKIPRIQKKRDFFQGWPILWSTYSINPKNKELTLTKEERVQPISQEEECRTIKNKKELTHLIGRLIPISESRLDDQTQSSHSYYHDLFRQGASLVPRNLVQIQYITNDSSDEIEIQPYSDIQQKKYSTWEFEAYQSTIVEKEYLFQIAKSSDLIPYLLCSLSDVFLPLERQVNSDCYKIPISNKLHGKKAQAHYEFLQKTYEQMKKPDAKVQTFPARLDYGHALTNPFTICPDESNLWRDW